MKTDGKFRYFFYQAIPVMLGFQIFTKVCLIIGTWLLKHLAELCMRSAGRVAVSSGDLLFLFTSWQGWLLIVSAAVLLFLYTAFDLNTKIYYCSAIIRNEPVSVKSALLFDIKGIRRFLNISGLFTVLYIALIAPIVGGGISISLTQSFYIPTFITSVIDATPLYAVLYYIGMAFFAIIGLRHIFVLHGVLLSENTVKGARKDSNEIIRSNWKNFFKESILFVLWIALLVLAAVLISFIIPALISYGIFSDPVSGRTALLFICILSALVIGLLALLSTPFYLLKITQLYYSYKEGGRVRRPVREKRRHPALVSGAVIIVLLCLITAFAGNARFDELFPAEVNTKVIAHRGGGNDGVENTLSGLETAIELGAYGSEIDIQRTKDGHYIVNHDSTFSRLTGNGSRPEDLTLEEVRALRIRTDNGEGEKIATFEEMLDSSKGRIVLFVELKGNTADHQMVDDAAAMVKERDMVDDVVLISLKYDLIDYAKTRYPEMQTAYLLWAAYGKVAELNCDYFGLEGESATSSAIAAIHSQGKQVMVWTPNTIKEQKQFLLSDADYIITDNIIQAQELTQQLEERSEFDRIIDAFARWLS